MPPKAKAKEDPNAAAQSLQRPSTANDKKILSTVKELQQLMDTDVKWKNRVSSAKHMSQVCTLKIQKLLKLIQDCDMGMASLRRQMTEFVSSLKDVVYSNSPAITSSSGVITRAAPPPPAAPGAGSAAAAAAPPAKGKGAAAPLPAEDQPTEQTLRTRQLQVQHLGSLIWALYDMPRLQKEKPPLRPQNATEMAKEFDLAAILHQPNQGAPQAAEAASPKEKGAKGGGPLRPPKAPKVAASVSAAADGAPLYDSFLGDLPASDFFATAVPRGMDPTFLQYVCLMRSKRLRLEYCKSLFDAELAPLRRRTSCSEAVTVVGKYGVEAVAPHIQAAVQKEQQLQLTRQQEDQAFLAKARASSAPPGPAGKGK